MFVEKHTHAYVLQTQYCADDVRCINEVSVCHTSRVVKYYAQPTFKWLDNRLYCQLGQLSMYPPGLLIRVPALGQLAGVGVNVGTSSLLVGRYHLCYPHMAREFPSILHLLTHLLYCVHTSALQPLLRRADQLVY